MAMPLPICFVLTLGILIAEVTVQGLLRVSNGAFLPPPPAHVGERMDVLGPGERGEDRGEQPASR